MEGIVIKSTGSWYVVKMTDGRLVNCRMKGKFRLDELKTTNPVAVGDHVEVEAAHDGTEEAVISEIKARKNYLSRQSPRQKFNRHIIAANVDQLLLIATISQPRTSSGFIDRCLVTAEAFHIPAHIIFNKQDILRPKDLDKQEEMVETYRKVGYPVLLTSATEGVGIEELKDLLKDKVSLIAGHSGVGKSTLINAVFPEMELKTRDISRKHQKGVHTTTYAEMLELPSGGYIIDTPGIKEFGILDLEPEEVCHYFPEMRVLLNDCKFNNCLHIDEPGCAVKDALMELKIEPECYKNYFNIVMDCQNKKPHYA